jgi:superfamily II DNA helicase RecQ
MTQSIKTISGPLLDWVACLDSTGVTIVVVPFRALINDLVDKAKKAGIDSME